MRDLQREQASLLSDWLEEEAPAVAAELRVSEDAARKALAAAAQSVHARIDRRAALALPGTVVESDSSNAKKS